MVTLHINGPSLIKIENMEKLGINELFYLN